MGVLGFFNLFSGFGGVLGGFLGGFWGGFGQLLKIKLRWRIQAKPPKI